MYNLQGTTVSVSVFIFLYQYLNLKKSLVGSGGMDLEPHVAKDDAGTRGKET